MTNSAAVWPSSTIAAAMSAPTCASVRPGLEPLAHPGVHPVDRGARGAQLRDLGGVLAHPQLAQDGPARVCSASGRASRSPNTCTAGIVSATASRVGPPARSLTSRYGSSPSIQVTTSTPSSSSGRRPSPAPPAAARPARAARGARRRAHQAGEPLVARAGRVDQVAQVGAGGDEQQRRRRARRRRRRPAGCGRRAARWERPVSEARSHEAQYAPLRARSTRPAGACRAVGRHRGASTLRPCPPLLLLDAASLYFRAFYGVPDSITAPDGTPVNAVRGFTTWSPG